MSTHRHRGARVGPPHGSRLPSPVHCKSSAYHGQESPRPCEREHRGQHDHIDGGAVAIGATRNPIVTVPRKILRDRRTDRTMPEPADQTCRRRSRSGSRASRRSASRRSVRRCGRRPGPCRPSSDQSRGHPNATGTRMSAVNADNLFVSNKSEGRSSRTRALRAPRSPVWLGLVSGRPWGVAACQTVRDPRVR
jgi:hypothetical protein